MRDYAPVVIEMRMREAARQFANAIMISDVELQTAMAAEFDKAIKDFDFRAEVEKAIRAAIQDEIPKILRNAIDEALYGFGKEEPSIHAMLMTEAKNAMKKVFGAQK